MSKRVYISADYDEDNGDRCVVEQLHKWANDNLHSVEFDDMSQAKSGSVSDNPDCRICDLKSEFNRRINASSAVIFIVGDKTANRTAGSACERNHKEQYECWCTPYKENANGRVQCKHAKTIVTGPNDDIGSINQCSYLRHEFLQAQRRGKTIIILYNSTRKEEAWLPAYMEDYKSSAIPFWKYDAKGQKVGDYYAFKNALGV